MKKMDQEFKGRNFQKIQTLSVKLKYFGKQEYLTGGSNVKKYLRS